MGRKQRWMRVLIGVYLLAGALPGAAQGGDFQPPRIELEMLAFDDAEHFRAVLASLGAEQRAAEEISTPQNEEEARVFQEFAEALGFESLLTYVESVEAILSAEGEVEINTSLDPREPSNHHILDPHLRGLVNPRGEVMVGTTIFSYQPRGYFKIPRSHLEALDRIRRGDEVEDVEEVVFVEYKAAASCCFDNYSKTNYTEYDGGRRRIKRSQWIRSDELSTSVGAATENQRKKRWGGRWVRHKADRVGVSLEVMTAVGSCSGEDRYVELEAEQEKERSVALSFAFGDLPDTPVFVSDLFYSEHWATDSGDSTSATLEACGCPPAVPAFTLPETRDSGAGIVLDGSATENEQSYFLEIHRADGTQWWSRWFQGQIHEFDLSRAYVFSAPGGVDTTYVVKLAVKNYCSGFSETLDEIEISGASTEVTYRSLPRFLGWLGRAWNGEVSGSQNEDRPLYALELQLASQPSGMRICYQTYAEGAWLPAVCDGATSGTTSHPAPPEIEGLKVWLENAPAGCRVHYKANIGGLGWEDWWANDGEVAGLVGEGRQMEAFRVLLEGCP